uniref:ANK_REP_REGION domain-containing protein n=1 Tax=Syphacia muris TaxID=451379 RepID=A0A0N5AFQ1_9BILA
MDFVICYQVLLKLHLVGQFCMDLLAAVALTRNTVHIPTVKRIDDIDVPEGRCTDCEDIMQKVLSLICGVAPNLIFLRRGGDISPLMDAVENNSLAMVTTLLRLGVDVEAEDFEGRTALHYAANRGLSQQIAVLLSNGASALHQDHQGVTPIHLAALYGFTASLRLLYTASDLTVYFNQKYCVIFIITDPHHVIQDIATTVGYTAFLWSAYYGVDASLKTFISLNNNIDRKQVDNEGCTALHLAATQGHNKCVELLIKENWALEVSFLHWMILPSYLCYIFEFSKARNLQGATPLLLTAKTGRLETARVLVENGADTSARDLEGNTCIHLGAGTELPSKEFHSLLLMLSASELINARNLVGETALHIAVEADSYEHVVELVEFGASIKIRNKNGWDPFMYAIRYGCKNVIAFLLRNFPNVNCYSSATGYSTLSVALECGNTQLVLQLRSCGAKMPRQILYDAAVKIQRWYRKQTLIRKMCSVRKTSEKVRQVCVRLSSSMFDAGFDLRCTV